ncbi:hypothetical protein [Pseudomonas tolaasii]|uniref:hypothetical protein n=1 Tax=Pseudomonas tolaasii TaxID=29442 RepID=UPI0015BFBBCB|nr:hypothetical protein [Pseudomonas tolaasii]MBW4790785.1 hypothetical protein [Pseudomonas tolaasii]NWC28467.1 hypothetical protein [Pseudomonas tolaasii]NWC51657.1 hypothetical protein [Pseudomonas tolaasii]NWE65274.1 hypothetical protein [Pseudomonas tolaasii]
MSESHHVRDSNECVALERLHQIGFSGPVAAVVTTVGRLAWWGMGSKRENRWIGFGLIRVVPMSLNGIVGFMDTP